MFKLIMVFKTRVPSGGGGIAEGTNHVSFTETEKQKV